VKQYTTSPPSDVAAANRIGKEVLGIINRELVAGTSRSAVLVAVVCALNLFLPEAGGGDEIVLARQPSALKLRDAVRGFVEDVTVRESTQ
jgi:hypothetical protein